MAEIKSAKGSRLVTVISQNILIFFMNLLFLKLIVRITTNINGLSLPIPSKNVK